MDLTVTLDGRSLQVKGIDPDAQLAVARKFLAKVCGQEDPPDEEVLTCVKIGFERGDEPSLYFSAGSGLFFALRHQPHFREADELTISIDFAAADPSIKFRTVFDPSKLRDPETGSLTDLGKIVHAEAATQTGTC
jgi:hypothetical protein